MSPASIEPVADNAIAATNVRPAYEASLQFGASEEELERRTGLTRALLEDDAATVSGTATYEHMELMFGKPRYAEFVVAAASSHTLSTLGVVGLACKTAASVGEAMLCHQRFQHLTNRTARYETGMDPEHLVIREVRPGPARLGSCLISDYTMLIAVQLLRANAPAAPGPVRIHSRRSEMPEAERAVYEAFAGGPVLPGHDHASLVYPRSIVTTPIPSADEELAGYFRSLLDTAGAFADEGEPPLLRMVRLAIRDRLVHGTPTAADVARQLGIGVRTLQRRIAEHDVTFAELLDTTRRRLAEGYLADATLSLAEVAYLLGYREQTSFYRAFRRWHGTTPAAFRAASD